MERYHVPNRQVLINAFSFVGFALVAGVTTVLCYDKLNDKSNHVFNQNKQEIMKVERGQREKLVPELTKKDSIKYNSE